MSAGDGRCGGGSTHHARMNSPMFFPYRPGRRPKLRLYTLRGKRGHPGTVGCGRDRRALKRRMLKRAVELIHRLMVVGGQVFLHVGQLPGLIKGSGSSP